MSSIQYTIRNVPESLDRRLRLRSEKSGQSFNTTLIQALNAATAPAKGPGTSDIDWFYGSGGIGQEELDAFTQQRKIDKRAWESNGQSLRRKASPYRPMTSGSQPSAYRIK